jgi:hypothetical protein
MTEKRVEIEAGALLAPQSDISLHTVTPFWHMLVCGRELQAL